MLAACVPAAAPGTPYGGKGRLLARVPAFRGAGWRVQRRDPHPLAAGDLLAAPPILI